MEQNKTVWAFDLGIGSIGEAVRLENRFLHKASLLIPADFAETKTASGRRRMWRTRIAHKEREKWLKTVLGEAGIEILRERNYDDNGLWSPGRAADPRLEREFPAPDDPTCYTSCLLRIRLLRSEKLESWQVYKALHSAIQRRGYDSDIPWKTRAQRAPKKSANPDDDEAGTQARAEEYVKQLQEMAPEQDEFHLPCYFDAWKMGLWDPSNPTALRERVDCRAESIRNQIVPRRIVEKEIRLLTEAAALLFPKLNGKADYLLYGPAQRAYASYYPELRKKFGLREGGANDWQGVLGQKIPRFDNRIIGKCVLIPRLNVCKIRTDDQGVIHPKSRLAAEVAFLMKLKNMRIHRVDRVSQLTAGEIQAIFENPEFQKLNISESAWKKKVCIPLGARPLLGHEKVEAPKISGRARFCRPALNLIRDLILSGDSPSQFQRAAVARLNGNTDPLKGLVEDDLRFLLQMGETWEGIYIPNQKLEALVRGSGDSDKAIRNLIGSQNDPVVRHRLGLFADRLCFLQNEIGGTGFGVPQQVVLEFVREDFMGRKAKLEYNRFLKERTKERATAKMEAVEAGNSESSGGFKMELFKAQKGICLYTGEGLAHTDLDQYVVDHIVPRAKGGPDAALNYVLTTRRANDEKGNQTPFEWFGGKEGWDPYVERVRERISTLRNKKVQLLVSPDAATLVDKYTALAETAWISKLAQAILDLQFGWRNGVDGEGRKRVTVVSGGLTGRIRRKYGLNRILNPDAKTEEEAEKKNRSDDRHHALDAMVISFIPGWMRDASKRGFFKFPEGIHRESLAREISEVIPKKVCFEKAALAETIYGIREKAGKRVIVQRKLVVEMAQKPIAPSKTKFDLEYARKQVQGIRDPTIRIMLSKYLKTQPGEREWIDFCKGFSLTKKGGDLGSPVRLATVDVGSADEYKDFSKDESGAFRKGLKGHKGQIVYRDAAKKIRVRPIYSFESLNKVRSELFREVPNLELIGVFQSGCLVELADNVEHAKTPLAPGTYRLNTIKKSGAAVVTNSRGFASLPIALEKLVGAGFKLKR
jgi:CRISPR-associated endonuclease Csn1